MEAKEKAKELVDKLYQPLPFEFEHTKPYSAWETAKQCALIAVEEIEQFMMMDDEYNKDCHMANTHWVQYWQQVKAEIEKM